MSCEVPADHREEIRGKMHLNGSLPFWSGALAPHRKPPTLIRRDLEGYTESGRLRLHTHSEQHIQNCSTK